jgi:hypothetical protein
VVLGIRANMAGSTPSLVSFAAQFLAVCVLVVSRATLHALAVRLPPELRVLRAVPPTEDTVTTTLWKSQNGSARLLRRWAERL